MNRWFEQVKEFHEAVCPDQVRSRGDLSGVSKVDLLKLLNLRGNLIREETLETLDALDDLIICNCDKEGLSKVDKRILASIADGLGDTIVVCIGTALALGIDIECVMDRIYESNMSKVDPSGSAVYREDGKILKGDSYFPPQLGDCVS